MPTCDVCGGGEFEEEDGLYYCSVCQTQSQVMQTVELEETDGPTLSLGTLREIDQKKKTREHSEHFKNEYEAGKPWSKYDAYQLILQAQADSLVKHGAHPSVKDAVMRLWAKYLSKLGVAFTDKIRLVPEGLEHLPFQREVYRGDFDKPQVNYKKWKRKIQSCEYLAAIRKHPKGTVEDTEDSAIQALEGETFYKGDNPFEGDNQESRSSDWDTTDIDVIEEEGDDIDDEGDSDARFGRSTASQKKRRLKHTALYTQPQYMRLRKTLVFCYFGCLFTSPWITLSDIIRWAKEGSVPYLETTHLLRNDMKLTAFDPVIFKPSHISNPLLLTEAGALTKYLDILALPPFNIKWTISKFITALDLPAEMHSLTLTLCERMSVKMEYKPNQPIRSAIPNTDAVCAAYIFVMLKTVFGLDDVTERQLSLYTKKAQAALGSDVHLFDWSAWHTHITRKFLTNSTPKADAVCELFHRAGFQQQTFSDYRLYNWTKRKRDARYKQENREMLKRPLTTLLERWTQRQERAKRLRQHSSHLLDRPPALHSRDQEVSDPDQPESGGANDAEEEAEEIGKRLQQSTLRHITEPETFLREKLAEGKERNRIENSSDSDSPSQDRDMRSPRITGSPSESSLGDLTEEEAKTARKHLRSLKKRFEKSTNSSDLAQKHTTPSKQQSAASEHHVDSSAKHTRELPCNLATSPKKRPLALRRQSGSSKKQTGSSTTLDADDLISDLLADHVSAKDSYILYPQLTARQEQHFPHLVKEVAEAKHYSYRWLLSVLAHLIHCPEQTIEKSVNRIQQCFVARGFEQKTGKDCGSDADSLEEFSE